MQIPIPRFAWKLLGVLLAAALTAGALIVATTKASGSASHRTPENVSESIPSD